MFGLQGSGNQKWKRGTFDNIQDGFKAFTNWVKPDNKAKYHAVMEATGRYGEDLATFLYKAGSVINPAQIEYYSQSLLKGVKTDKVDSQLIAEFAQRHELSLWKPLPILQQAFKEQVRCLGTFKADAVQISNRLDQAKDLKVRNMLEELLTHIQEQIADLEKKLHQATKTDASLKKDKDLLMSIPGLGETSAFNLLAELPDLKTFKCVKQLAAYAGLNPSIRTSGTSVKDRGGLSRIGSASLRKILYFPALTLIRVNSPLSPFIQRLRDKGKPSKVIVAAVMRKLLHIIFGVLKRQQMFQG